MARSTPHKAVAPQRHIALDTYPGHAIRRLQQLAVALFMQESLESGVTPVQFAVLYTLSDQPGIDQRTLASSVSFDTSTIGGVVDRLEARGLLTRSHSPGDRRVRLLHLTPEGVELLKTLVPSMKRAQDHILAPLGAAERKEFMRMLRRVIEHHEASAAAGAATS